MRWCTKIDSYRLFVLLYSVCCSYCVHSGYSVYIDCCANVFANIVVLTAAVAFKVSVVFTGFCCVYLGDYLGKDPLLFICFYLFV